LDDPLYFVMVNTSFGPVTVLWQYTHGEPVVRRITLPSGGGPVYPPAAIYRPATALAPVLAAITAAAEGRGGQVSLDIISLAACPPFHRRVLALCATIPRGRTTSYGLMAEGLGCTGGSRAVGQALARNPFPLIIPCHRVVRSDGSVGGFGGGGELKRRLLTAEGVAFTGQNRVVQAFFVDFC
ncbi:MAG: MGMT family protein, partial [Syntrophales bacterium]|nr:MGMT family protein [Syntrophales bacterium]